MNGVKYLTMDEADAVRQAALEWADHDELRHRPQGILAWVVVDTAMQTGLRVAEIALLKVGDFNPNRKTLRVHRLKRRKPVIEDLPISESHARHLEQYLDWKRRHYKPTEPQDALFHGKHGPLGVDGMRGIWESALKRAGVEKREGVSIHAARHTLGVHLLRKTKNLRLVQKQLGHQNPQTTAIYADVLEEDRRAGINGLYEQHDPRLG